MEILRSFLRLVLRGVARLFPKWWWKHFWKYGASDAIARTEVLEKLKDLPNSKVFEYMVEEIYFIVLSLFNPGYAGSHLADYTKPLSVRSFKQIYAVILTLLEQRLENSQDANSHFQDLRATLLYRLSEETSIRDLAPNLEKLSGDDDGQARVTWDRILQIIGGDAGIASGFWRGTFVLLTQQATEKLQKRWIC